ncbi:uncharacterized protein LOC115006273 isoform X2 [Cottoperca gobio]|nr:uncharacterized protein LOC115006273 isoform X2 [Cottoperca gobio]
MQTTKVIKPRPVGAARRTRESSQPVTVRTADGGHGELKVPAVRKSRASSCPRCPRRDRCEGPAFKPSCERRARSSSTAPKTSSKWPRTNPEHRKTSSSRSSVKPAAVEPTRGELPGCQREPRHASQSHTAFTVIPPNPKRRREIQRKAEAELAALEEFRLSRAMAYVSINPSSVGGCMSLEEVRLKQQQDMMEANRKQKPV